MTHPRRHTRQRGMVLIMAMFIVVLVTTVVVSISWRYQLQSQRNENRWHGSQARAYLEGGEQLAMLMLTQDDLNPQVDTMWEDWAQMSDPLPTDEGWIRGKLEDAQGKFDLNNLLIFHDLREPLPNNQRRPDRPGVLESLYHVRFIRLLQTFELAEGPLQLQEAVELTEAIVDWIDPDNDVTGTGGAEMGEYQGREIPYFCANRPMVSVSELMVLKQIQERPEIYQQLRPCVVALPRPPGQELTTEYPLNLNTMPDVMFRIFNVDEPIPIPAPLPADGPEIQRMLEIRAEKAPEPLAAGAMGGGLGAFAGPGGFTSVEEFNGAISGLIPGTMKLQGLGIETDWFLFSAETLVGEQVRRSKTLMFRDPSGQKVDIIRRADANF